MNTVIIPFIKYNRANKLLGRLLFEYVMDNIDRIDADQVLICPTRMGLDECEFVIDGKTVRILKDCGSIIHQENIERGIATLSSGDKFVVMDSDCVIYDRSVFADIFSDLNNYDIVGNLDSGTRVHPTHVLFVNWQKADMTDSKNLMYRIPIMRPISNRGVKTRFAATLFGCSYDFYTKYNVAPDKNCDIAAVESMELFSRNVASLLPSVRVKEMYDYRHSVLVNEQNMLYCYNNSNDTRVDDEMFNMVKYYHMRNFGDTLKMIDKSPNSHYTSQLQTNPSEGLRLLSWFQIILEKVCAKHPEYSVFMNNIDEVLTDHNIDAKFYQSHLALTKQYHRTHLL